MSNGVIDLEDEGTSVGEDVETRFFTGFPPRARREPLVRVWTPAGQHPIATIGTLHQENSTTTHDRDGTTQFNWRIVDRCH